jgi:hypothetical protein
MHPMNSNILKKYARLPILRAAAGAATVGSVLALSGCVVAVRPAPAPVVYEQPVPGAPEEVTVTQDPPAPLYETVGIAPGPGFIWVGGFYEWNGGGWIWRRGHYAHPPRPGAVWFGPRYEFRGGRRVFIRGYWR